MFKYQILALILFILASCSSDANFEDKRSSSLIKPNFTSTQSMYDCTLLSDKSLNNLEAFIPKLVKVTSVLYPSASLEFLFNQKDAINSFSIVYSDKQTEFNSPGIMQIFNQEGIKNIAKCITRDDIMLSSNIFIDNKPITFTTFEVEILNCKFNEGYNFGTFAIEIDTFLNLVRSKGVQYFAKFQQIDNQNTSFTWINYLGTEEDKMNLYKGWLEAEDSINIQESFNIQSKCESSSSYKGYKVL